MLKLHASSDLTLVWMPMPAQIDTSTSFTRVTSRYGSFKRCFVTIPSANPSVTAYISASAKQKLTDCCVLDHAERVALLHCVTQPLVLLHVKCSPAQSLSVYTFTNCGNVLSSIKRFALGTPFKCRAMRFIFSPSLSVGQRIFFCCFLHAVHDVSTLLDSIRASIDALTRIHAVIQEVVEPWRFHGF